MPRKLKPCQGSRLGLRVGDIRHISSLEAVKKQLPTGGQSERDVLVPFPPWFGTNKKSCGQGQKRSPGLAAVLDERSVLSLPPVGPAQPRTPLLS